MSYQQRDQIKGNFWTNNIFIFNPLLLGKFIRLNWTKIIYKQENVYPGKTYCGVVLLRFSKHAIIISSKVA